MMPGDINFEDGQRKMDEWFENLPFEIEEVLSQLKEKVKQYESFQLISNITHYNHLRDTKKYSDYNDGRMAVIAELVSILCIKLGYIENCQIPEEGFHERFMELQETAAKYYGLFSTNYSMGRLGEETALQRITNKLNRDEIVVRNPGLLEHHFLISENLFKPLNSEIKKAFGFDIYESLNIRKNLLKLFQKRFKDALDDGKVKADVLKNEVVRFRNTGIMNSESYLTRDDFIQLKPYSSKQLKTILLSHFINQIHFNLKTVYVFTVEELASHCNLELAVAQNFLDHFCCEFGSVKEGEEIVGALTILKNKPIIKRNSQYIIPSFALLDWAVEPTIESFFKQSQKLSNKFKDIKHEYLLNFGIELLTKIMPNATIFPPNLYYTYEGKRAEADGLIGYDTTLFIIEAKGNRITDKAKDGNYQRTDNHLKDLIKEATKQAERTLNYIQSTNSPEFHTKQNQTVKKLNPQQYDEFVLVSLTLEPIGNLTPLIKVENDLSYFNENRFPLIISIYDLIVMADHFDVPISFLHYLKRRKRFLEIQNMYIFEEIDLMGYYLANGLYIEHTIEKAKSDNIHMMMFDNETDEINDYYMYKFGHKEQFTPKVKIHLPIDFIELLNSIETSQIEHRVNIMYEMMEFSTDSIKMLMKNIHKVKGQFKDDGDLHDCSICSSRTGGGVGITFMTASDKDFLDEKLYQYCLYKFHQVKAKVWVGIGDLSSSTNGYNIKCSFIAKDIQTN